MNLDLSPVEKELKYAEEEFAIVIAEQYNITDQGERRWRNFVDHLEKSFTYLIVITSKTKFQNTVDAAFAFKKKDELLKYVRESRNTHQHEPKELTAIKKDKQVNFADSGIIMSFSIKKPDGNSEILNMTTDDVFELKFTLKTVLDIHGKTYDPPRTHFKKPVSDPESPEVVGQLALNYYKNLVESIKNQI